MSHETKDQALARNLTEIAELLRDVGDAVNDYAGNAAHSPEALNWADVGTLGHVREDLEDLALFLGLRDEREPCSVCRVNTVNRVEGVAAAAGKLVVICSACAKNAEVAS